MSKNKPSYFLKTGNGLANIYDDNDKLVNTCNLKEIPEKLEDKTVYTIDVNTKHLKLIWRYLENLTRFNALQVEEISDGLLENILELLNIKQYSQEYYNKRNEIKHYLNEVRKAAGSHTFTNLGINNVCNDDKVCYEIYKMIGYALYHIDGHKDWNVYSDKPLKVSDQPFINVNLKEELPSIYHIEEFVDLIKYGRKPIIEFNNNHRFDADPGMRGIVTSFKLDNTDENGIKSYEIVTSLDELEEHNKKFARKRWITKNGEYSKTWFETEFYPKDGVFSFFVMSDCDCLNEGLSVIGFSK